MLDFVKLSRKHRVPLLEGGHHHCHDGWVQTHCPYCSGGRGGWHLGFSLEMGNFNCWRCGPLRFWDVLTRLLRTSDQGHVRDVVSEFQRDGPRPVKKQVARKRELTPPPRLGDLLPVHIDYLSGRGFDPAHLAHEYDVRGTAGLSGTWSWRVVFPVRAGDERVVAYQGRAVGDVKPKYKMTDDEDCLDDPKALLYGLDKVDGDSVIVVEGATGVWRLGAGAVGTLGIDWNRKQANRLRRFKNRFILFDPEPQAQRRAHEIAKHLSLFDGETEILSGFDVDPGDLKPREARQIRRELGMPVAR